MEFIQVSKKHLSSLNELIRTQHRLLKLKLPLSGDPSLLEQMNSLFADWSRLNSQLSRLYDGLQMGTICLQEKQKNDQKIRQLKTKVQDIEQTVVSMQYQKDGLQASCMRMKREMEDHDVKMSLQNAQLNKLSQEKAHLTTRLTEINQQLKKQKKEEAQALRICKDKLESYREKYSQLQNKYKKLEQLHNKKDQDMDDELDRELKQLQQFQYDSKSND